MKKKAFTLIELIAVLVILAILALIVTPLVMNIIRKAKYSANRRSVDAYGKSVELAITSYLMDTGAFPTDLSLLTIEYIGKEVICNVMQMKKNGEIYLSECTVGGKQVKDASTEDGYYHYGTRDLTNEEYVDMYGLSLKNASVMYYEANGNPVEDYRTLTIDYKGKPVSCDVIINYDGTIYMTKCKVDNVDVTAETEEDGYYHYGSILEKSAVIELIEKANKSNITNYTDGNPKEMYTFEHSSTEQTDALTDYRYIGANPNNYVYFNGNELWRIIGIFTVEDNNKNLDNKIKIVKDDVLQERKKWDSNRSNEWSTSTLNSYLNGEYYDNINEDSKAMISSTKYYLGGRVQNNCNALEFYTDERSNTVYDGRSTNWYGNIALPYVSDYLYTYEYGVFNGCGGKESGWSYDNQYEWFLTPIPGLAANVRYLDTTGWIGGYNVLDTILVRPTLYLNKKVKIAAGDGSEQNPYQLSL